MLLNPNCTLKIFGWFLSKFNIFCRTKIQNGQRHRENLAKDPMRKLFKLFSYVKSHSPCWNVPWIVLYKKKKRLISNLVRTAHFWNNLHQLHSMPKNIKVLGARKPKGLDTRAKYG